MTYEEIDHHARRIVKEVKSEGLDANTGDGLIRDIIEEVAEEDAETFDAIAERVCELFPYVW